MRNSILFNVALTLLFSSQIASAFPFGAGFLGTDIFGDTDRDLVHDTQEALDGTNPLLSDTDSDGLSDGQEATAGTNPLIKDSDLDGYEDGEEFAGNTDPLDANSAPRGGLNLMLIKAALDIKKAKEEAEE